MCAWEDANMELDVEWVKFVKHGEKKDIAILGEPEVQRKLNRQQQPQVRFVFPVLCNGRRSKWDCSASTARTIRALEGCGIGNMYRVTRKGKPNDTKTHYEFEAVEMPPEVAEAVQAEIDGLAVEE